MIVFNSIDFSYGKRRLFHDFSLSLDKGKVYGLLGKNGAGKSTLLYLLAGLLIPKKGKVEYDGVDVKGRKPSVLKNMFFVPEEFDLPNITLHKYISVNSPFYPDFSMEALEKGLEYFEMDRNSHLGELSLGEKKKVFMSFALATNTSLLILDEPTNGLDIPGKSQFRKFIASGMSDDKTIIISTHQVKDIDNMLEQIIILDDNQVLLNDSVINICRKLRFVESYSEKDFEKALYIAPSMQGCSLIMPNDNGEETRMNLELLFNAILTVPDKIKTLLR